jgi:hypothetical protein
LGVVDPSVVDEGPGRKFDRFSVYHPPPSGDPSAFVEEAAQGRESGKPSVTLSEGLVHGIPGGAGGLRDKAGFLNRPFAGTPMVAVDPLKDLVGGYFRFFLSHGVYPFPTKVAPLLSWDGLLPPPAAGKSVWETKRPGP